MLSRFLLVAAFLSVVAALTPVHANQIDVVDATIDLYYPGNIFSSSVLPGTLAGTIEFTYAPQDTGLGLNYPYSLTESNLTYRGTPLTAGGIIGNATAGSGVFQTFFPLPPSIGGGLFSFEVIDSDIGNLNLTDFVGATSGTVTITNEVSGVPLPSSLPMFGGAVLTLLFFGFHRKKFVSLKSRLSTSSVITTIYS